MMMNKIMLSCKETSRLISEELDHELPLYKRVMLRMHLAMCKGCKQAQHQIGALKKVLSSKAQSQETSLSSKGPSLSETSKEHMKSLLRKKDS